MDKIDVSLPILIDNAVIRYQNATEEIVDEFNIPYELAEIALEKALFVLKDRRIKLYASAAHESFKKSEEGSGINGNKNN